MKTSSEIIDALNTLERQFPVAQWRYSDMHLWPSYRLRLYGSAIDRLLLTQAPPQNLGRLGRLADRAARALWRVPLAAWRDRRANAPWSHSAEAVLFSDGVSFTPLNGQWFDRIVDPVMQALDRRGLHSLKLTPIAEAHVPRQRPSRFVQPSIDRIKLLASRQRPALETPQWDAFELAAQAAFGAPVPAREWLQMQAARLDALARWFGARLQVAGASCAFVNTYYSLEGQAFVLAARRSGMRTVDVQHGMQGEHHAAYARWLQVPAGGYSTLPDEFWVWGDAEAQAIGRWNAGLGTHRARITGNPWLQRWADDSDPLIAACLAQAGALRQPGKRHVLACLSWGLADEETEKLIQAARMCGPDVAWWWRLHPVESGKRSAFAARLQQQGLDGSQVGAATDLPLYALVRSADVTVAHSSTVIQEAAQLGVPSVVTSDYGAEFHAGLVHAGQALKATTPAAIAEAVRNMSARPRSDSPLVVQGDLLQVAVDDFFNSVPRHQPRSDPDPA
jgi:hypothetical protein